MDFFIYASTASNFTQEFWLQFLIGGLCFVVVFIFQGIALYTMASREGYKNKWMAFIPFFNTYYIGVCAQKNKFYNIDTKKIGLTAAIFEGVLFALYVVYYVACILIIESGVGANLSSDWFGAGEYSYNLETVRSVRPDLVWAAWMYNYMYDYILSVLMLVFTLIEVSLLICFFQTYACRRYVLFTITSILFPVQGVLFFIIRNNKALNYKEYLRIEQAKQYAMYQQYHQQHFNRNPYDRDYNNPYGNNSYNNPPPPSGNGSGGGNAPDDPFSGLGSSGDGGSPFDDFN